MSIISFNTYALDNVLDAAQDVKPDLVEKIGLLLAGSFIMRVIKISALILLIVVLIFVAIKLYKKFIKK